MTHRLFVKIVLLLVVCSPAAAQQYYRWMDENGTMHFSENPPPSEVQATQEEIPRTALTRGPSAAAVADEETAETATTATAAQEVNRTPGSTTNEEMCERIRANIQTLTNSPQIRRVDPDTGEVRMMDNTEHEEELERTRNLEQQYC